MPPNPSQRDDSFSWAIEQFFRANQLMNAIDADRRPVIEEAIACYRNVLQVVTREGNPEAWALVQMNLGEAFAFRIGGDRCRNVQNAIECYEKALEVWTKEAAPLDWAKLQTNLGSAFTDRIGGDRSWNVENAIKCYEKALEVWTKEAAPMNWATVQMNLGNALHYFIGGDRSGNVENAIECYEKALEVWTKEAAPLDWAKLQMNLGIAFTDRIGGDRNQNVENGIECDEKVLEVWTKDAAPLNWATVQMNLGNALQNRIAGNRGRNVENAIKCYEKALEVWTKKAAPLDWARVQFNLGMSLFFRFCDGTSDAEQAQVYLRNALTFISKESNPLLFLRVSFEVARVSAAEGSSDETRSAVGDTLKALEYVKSLTGAGLLHVRTLDEDYAALAGILATLYLSDGDYNMALERFDRFKASLLLGFLSEGVGIARRLSGDLDRFDSLRNRYRMLKHKLDLASGKLEFDLVLTELNDVKQNIDDIVAVVNKQNSITDALPVSSREMVEFLDRSKAIAIVLFFAPRKEMMKVRDFSEFLHAFSVWNGELRLHEGEMSYSDRRIGLDEGHVQQIWNFVSKILRAHHFENAPTRLVVVPHRHLHAIPFAALRIQIDESGREGKYLGDVFTGGIWMVPSLSIAVRVDERGVASKPLKECEIVSATCPTVRLRPQHEEVMQKIGFGGRSHVHIADPCPPHSEIMSRRELRTCDILHLTCHGTFAGGTDTAAAHLNPSEVVNATGLSFGTGDEALLNMADIWGMRLRNCTLATVVACSGAAVDVLSRSDESLSIGTALLVAGARNVVCTLWPVHDLSAAAIMSKCYEKLCAAAVDGDVDVSNISAFLREAQSWFRDLTDSEYFDVLDRFDPDDKHTGLDNKDILAWAPFVVIGPPPWYSQ